ncbi:hypothetical protein ACWEQ8_32180, partial [Streptomyces noursei]
DLKWTDPSVTRALTTLGQLFGHKELLAGGNADLRGTAAPCAGLEEAMETLAARGYEPHLEGPGGGDDTADAEPAGRVVRMRNCPFHAVAEGFPPLVCGMNLALLEGLFGTDGAVRARMDARPGECCVVIENSKNNHH